ncbi:hypothetical protein GV828_02290 [Flavobacterium sp. NST-5]|uniref:Regulatory protein MarR n=1 Tax=Flavobacterium ichthyis TaxID=2698827 RepID=A0ABW9Z7E2_9FLAO|nr:SatD family protein [Flavobacterium ichthyis]NBL64025.1 hypothetical protein [Flavobacterium ichthyis]
MTAIILGDIIKSRKNKSAWLEGLKSLLNQYGKSPINWEIFRGDQFQVEVKPEEALFVAIRIKSFLRSIKCDARMSIGLGEKSFKAKKISESNGTAFINSGETFETLKKERKTLAITSADENWNIEMNLLLRFATTIMDNWPSQTAEFVIFALENPQLSQEKIGEKLAINQAAVSRRKSRAQFDLIMDLNDFYQEKLKNL